MGDAMISPAQLTALEAELNHFNHGVRTQALAQLAEYSQNGTVPLAPVENVANLHCHTFFSFNAFGYSPTALAWLAKKNGYGLMGIVDFDVLDGVDEFLWACERLGVRASAGMETRIYLPEFATREINSPGEPGVSYYMGVGFTSSQVPPEVKPILDDLRQRATRRNRLVVMRINDFLSPVCVDYEEDVLPLTPGGNPTERHLVLAYLLAAQRLQLNHPAFWAEKLGLSPDQMADAMQANASFQNLVRSKLMKRGGVGYVEPTPETFPTLQEVNRLTLTCGAIPCVAWLDGTSQGEQDIEELLGLFIRQGAAVLNIVPDRNWNIPDEQVRQQKVQKLYEIVRLAGELDLPLNIGTEMNSFGQHLVDNFDAPELQSVRQAFLDGAHFMYGHTAMQRALGLGYESEWAQAHFPGRRERNLFYTRMGYRATPGSPGLEILRSLGTESTPDQYLALF
jgi:hypothetical protein